MNSLRAVTRRAALAAFLLFAAAVFVVGPADASRTTTDARSSLASISAPSLALSSSRELASLELPMLELPLLEPPASADISPRFGFAEDLGLLDPEAGPGGIVVFAVEAAQCALTYARNNPLRFVDPDGREEMDAVLMSTQRMQLRETGGEAAVQRFDRTNAAMAGAFVAAVAGGAAVAQWGPPAMMLGREFFTRFGDKVDEAVAESRAVTALARFERGISFEARQVQEKFDQHKSVLGITANWSKAAGAAFEGAIKSHVENANTMVIKGTFHKMGVTHFLDPRTGVNVMRDSAGKFLSVFRLNSVQLRNVMERGSL